MTVLHDAPIVSAEQRRTWSFIATNTGDLLTVTCPDWCEVDHSRDMETPTHPDDIWCQASSQTATLPINETGTAEETSVLSSTLNVRPFDRDLNARMPRISVEVMSDAWVEDLDPDALEHVIGTLQSQVDELRKAHAELVRARAQYRTRR